MIEDALIGMLFLSLVVIVWFLFWAMLAVVCTLVYELVSHWLERRAYFKRIMKD